jgi:phenylacetate-coenzyme A ligase PaaK-like adenylate-forming protein
MNRDFHHAIFFVKNDDHFNKLSLDIFRYQATNNLIYKEFVNALGVSPLKVQSPSEIPFLPVSFFKGHKVLTGSGTTETVFESSGTTGINTSRHFVSDPDVYEESFTKAFKIFFGDPSEYFFASLLPSYTERGNSSLIYMMNKLNQLSIFSESGFFNNNEKKLIQTLGKSKAYRRKAMLLGVSFALLDLAEKFSPDLAGITIVETGGMKGRRKEITRQELHATLKKGFNVETIYSEYGMTELLSQAWSKGEGLFFCPPWMKILIRDPQDPLTIYNTPGKTGGINIIDLANFNSCSFIAVNDLGKLQADGGFEVLGRFDDSEIRGCNLMVE